MLLGNFELFILLTVAPILGIAVLVLLGQKIRAERDKEAEIQESAARARILERQFIAQELHDTFLQGVNILTLNLQLLVDGLPTDSPIKTSMMGALDLTDLIVAEGRQQLSQLAPARHHPPFLEALEAKGAAIAMGRNVTFACRCSGKPVTLAQQVNHELTRIGGEALVNAFRHARASTIALDVRYSARELVMAVRDDGCGMPSTSDPADVREHLGLSIMRSRAEEIGARLDLAPCPGGGTCVELRLPLPTRAGHREPSQERMAAQSAWPWGYFFRSALN